MTAYLVEKRMKEDRVYMPGEILVDPPLRVDILRARGFLTIIPDNYKPAQPAIPTAPDDETDENPDPSSASDSEGGTEGSSGVATDQPSGPTGTIDIGAGGAANNDEPDLPPGPLPEKINLEAAAEREEKADAKEASGGKNQKDKEAK